jgi:hypothetical protein
MSTLPKIFNLDEGFIFATESTSNFTTGDREARMEILMTFSQLLTSAEDFDDLPLITIWNTSPTIAEDELGVTRTFEKVEADDEVNLREEHES